MCPSRFVAGPKLVVQRQQPDVKSRRTAEESRTSPKLKGACCSQALVSGKKKIYLDTIYTI